MRIVMVEISLRKGNGPEWVRKTYEQAYDDLPPEMEDYEIKKMAIADTERQLVNSEDYPWYGKNWIIEGAFFA